MAHPTEIHQHCCQDAETNVLLFLVLSLEIRLVENGLLLESLHNMEELGMVGTVGQDMPAVDYLYDP